MSAAGAEQVIGSGDDRPRHPSWLPGLVVWTVVGLVVYGRVRAVFTQNVNWDEFALLDRAVRTVESGVLQGGGRPGLGTLLLIPFAEECVNAVEAIVRARLFWTGLVVGCVWAFWAVLRRVVPDSPHRRAALITALGLWAMAPFFLMPSTQVRTDQPAILFGLLGALALLKSRDRLAWALAAGTSLGVGFLFSQKLLYVAGLAGVLAVGQVLIAGEWRPRRDLARAALAAGTLVVVVLGYRELMRGDGGAPALLPVGGQLGTFAFYEQGVGWSVYARMAPFLVPQLLVLGLLPVATASWLRDRTRHGGALLTAWLVLVTGLAVLLFHAGRFFYFYMVLGLFPAAVAALTLPAVLERLSRSGVRAAVLVVLWGPLAAAALPTVGIMTADALGPQREALAFVDRNLPPSARGFDAKGAFTCRGDPEPFPVRFPERVRTEFMLSDGDANGRALLTEFRTRPVSFMIVPLEFDFYPADVRQFWETRYVPYFGPLRLPGRRVAGGPETTELFEVVVPGPYVWRILDGGPAAPLEVAGRRLQPGEALTLTTPGEYVLMLPEGGEGLFVLQVVEPPYLDDEAFYRGS